jgi:amino acid adenylation domain-containing protein
MTSPGSRFTFDVDKAALLAALLAEDGLGAGEPERIPCGEDRADAPLSFAQQRLWFLDRLHPGNPFYNCDTVLPIRGRVDRPTLARALALLVDRHEQLRATFVEVDGQPVQRILSRVEVPLEAVDLRELPVADRRRRAIERCSQLAQHPFDLARGPLLRATLFTLGEADHLCLLVMHHVISDGWSLGVLVRELLQAYGAFVAGSEPALPPLPIRYTDFAVWQRAWVSGERRAAQLAYWKTQLEDLPRLELPLDRPRPALPSYAGAYVPVALPLGLTVRLRRLANQEGATLFVVLLAAFQVVLSRMAHQDEIVVGSPIANRNRAELEHLVGFFVNTQVLRTSLAGDPTVRALIQRTRETAFGAYDHQDLPFEQVVQELQPQRDLGHNPLFQVTFQLFDTGRASPQQAPLAASGGFQGVARKTSKFDLRLDLWPDDDGIHGQLEYATDIYDESTASAMLSWYRTVLEHFTAAPESRLSTLSLLDGSERARVLRTWNATTRPFPDQVGVHTVFEAQARRTPEATAVRCGAEEIRYAMLDARAATLAAVLQARGVGPGDRVGVFMGRSSALVVALLGILKAGAAYVPLDPTYPPVRLAFMVEDSGVRVVLTRPEDGAQAEGLGAEVIDVVTACTEPRRPRPVEVTGEDAAYVMYTSGSTGQPKGVVIPHRGIVRLAIANDYLVLGPEDRVGHGSNISFDAATFEIWNPLLAGASVEVIPRDVALVPADLERFVQRQGLTVLFVTTVLFMQCMEARPGMFATLSTLLVGGSTANPRTFARIFEAGPPRRFLHVYGPTENTTFSTFAELRAPLAIDRPPPIGRPLANSTCYVIDHAGQPAPPGLAGELWVGGAGLALGYHDRPELTDERFVVPAFPEAEGRKIYRTGDRVRWDPSGALIFLGRLDRQVKVRGFRVEPGEIDAVLRSCPPVRECVTVVREDRAGDQRIVSYLVAEEHAADDEAVVERWKASYDEVVYAQGGPATGDVRFDVTGWNSSYTNEPLPQEQMREQVDGTVGRLRALRPRRVLEVGVGTGLLMFPLLPWVERFVGTDISQRALDGLRAALGSERADDVALHALAAHELDRLPDEQFDLVVANSTLQYLPSLDYLETFLRRLVTRVAPGGHIFLGDVRNLDLLDSFYLSLERHAADPETSLAAVGRRRAGRRRQEQELVISPRWLRELGERIPELTTIHLQDKRGRAWNELTAFRFDAVLEVRGEVAPALPERRPWASLGSIEALRAAIDAALPAGGLLIDGLPTLRTSALAQALDQLRRDEEGRLGALAGVEHGLHPEDLWALEQSLPVQVSFFGGHQGEAELLVVPRGTRAPEFPSRMALPGGPPATDPKRGRFARDVLPTIRAWMKDRVPSFMLPSAFVRLDALPLCANGKLDHAALPAPDDAAVPGRHDPPRGAWEERIAAVWAEVLGLAEVGRGQGFFSHLGGHSLLATQVVARLREQLRLDMPLRLLFEFPTLEAFARQVESRSRHDERAETIVAAEQAEIGVADLSDRDVDTLLRLLEEGSE